MNYGILVSTIAVDFSTIKQKTKITIPTLHTPWNELVFLASDVGPAITVKHIDVYAWEGKQAELEIFRITSGNNKIGTK